jgi:hypothetical protein
MNAQNTTELLALEPPEEISEVETPKIGRPPIPIDWDKVRELAELQVDGNDIAAFMGINENTFYAACRRVHKMSWEDWAAPHRGRYLVAARKIIWERALAGNDRMLAMVARKYLGFKDEVEVKNSGTVQHQHIHVLVNATDEDKTRRIEELKTRLLPKTVEVVPGS